MSCFMPYYILTQGLFTHTHIHTTLLKKGWVGGVGKYKKEKREEEDGQKTRFGFRFAPTRWHEVARTSSCSHNQGICLEYNT